ncbi:MAG: agmatinase family protein [Polyangiaceae bacterium]
MAEAMPPFDPNAPAAPGAGLFGLPFSPDAARLVVLPVPWEATTSYGGGTSQGPRAVFEASRQVDLYDLDVTKPYEAGIAILEEDPQVVAWNEEGKAAAARVIADPFATGTGIEADREVVNRLSAEVNRYVERETERLFASGKLPGILGGDHSVPFGAIRAAARRFPKLGILHVDAHSDTRAAYEGFEHSHASIMWNVCRSLPNLERLVQVGIRDICEAEVAFVESLGDRARVFYDRDLTRARHRGEPWERLVDHIVAALPGEVWVSFDIDGLDPRFCPHTGTPVPGGLDFSEAVTLLRTIVSSGRSIVGFDLSEVAPNGENAADEWDANVGARLLYKLCAFSLASQGLAKLRD